MAQTIARDVPYSTPQETGRYALALPFANYPSPNTSVRKITRSYRVTHKGYAPAITNLTNWTNSLPYSDDFTRGAYWNYNNASALVITFNATTDPEAGTACSSLVETAVTQLFYIGNQLTVVSLPAAMTGFGVMLKFAGRQYGCVSLFDATPTTIANATFDLVNGVVMPGIAGNQATASIRPAGNGWYWCTVAGLIIAPGVPKVYVSLSNNGLNTPTYAGVAGAGIYVCRATVVSGAVNASSFPPIDTPSSAGRTISAPDFDALANPFGEDADPLAYQCQEGDPQAMATGLLQYTKTYSRIPPEFITPTNYLFTTPDYSGGAQAALPGVFSPQTTIIGFYGVMANVTTTSALVNGYYDVAFPVSSIVALTSGASNLSTASISQLTVAGNNYAAGDVLLLYYQVTGVNYWSCTVTSVSGSLVNVVGITCSVIDGLFPTGAGQYVRKRIKDTPDVGQVVGLRAQVIEDYYLPGVSPGISTFTDIPAQNPFNIVDYFSAIAGNLTWFNVQADALTVWMGQILVRKYTQGLLPAATPHGLQTVTASGNFTVPAGVTNLRRVAVVNGGAGGGYGGTTGGGGGGSGASIAYFENIACTPGQIFAVVIGAGGVGGTSGSTTGGSGGFSSFGGLTPANASNGGKPPSGSTGGAGGLSPAARGWVGGTGNTTGGGGGASFDTSGTNAAATAGTGAAGNTAGGGGGASSSGVAALGGLGVFGNGSAGGNPASNGGSAPANSGAGGGGGGGGGGNGGPGGSGVVIITY